MRFAKGSLERQQIENSGRDVPERVWDAIDERDAALAAAHTEAARLREALEKIGHAYDCALRWNRLCTQPDCAEIHERPCSCGLDEALKA